MFLFDRTARIDTTEVSTCQGSFGGFKTTCFQLDRAASFKTTGIFYFSCDRSTNIPHNKLVIVMSHCEYDPVEHALIDPEPCEFDNVVRIDLIFPIE